MISHGSSTDFRSPSSAFASFKHFPLRLMRASVVLWIRVLGGRLSGRDQQPGKLDLRLLRLPFDEFDQKFPSVAVVEEESHLGPDRWEGLDDTRPLDASCLTLALSHIDEQFISHGRREDVSLQLAVEAERVIKVEIEGPDDRLREFVQAARILDLERSIDFRRKRSAKNQKISDSAIRRSLRRRVGNLPKPRPSSFPWTDPECRENRPRCRSREWNRCPAD